MTLEERIKSEIEGLGKIRDSYEKLNQKSKYAYDWRERALNDIIDSLETMLEGKSQIEDWKECYEEDLREVEQ